MMPAGEVAANDSSQHESGPESWRSNENSNTMIERRRLSVKPKPTKDELLARFKGKNGASRKGKPNKVTRVLKEAMILAAERVGENGRGRGGLVGYLEAQAREYPRTYLQVLAKLLPLDMQITALQLQLQANANGGAMLPLPEVINIDEIRAMPTDDLRRVAAYMQRVLVPLGERHLKRIDEIEARQEALREQQHGVVIDSEAMPIEPTAA